jgi:hypothetical protein
MEIVVTHRKRLCAKYGPQVWDSIQSAVDEYLDVLDATGRYVRLELLDDVVPSSPAPGGEWKAIKAALRDLCAKHGAEYLVILGGDSIVPFFRLWDRTQDRIFTPTILSDSYYVDFQEAEEEHWPDVAVGRFPDGGADGGELLRNYLNRATYFHRQGGVPTPTKWCGLSTSTWEVSSKQIYGRIDRERQFLKFSPPAGRELSNLQGVDTVIQPDHFTPGGLVYINLHGHAGNGCWYGEQRFAGFAIRNPVAVDCDLLRKADLTGCVVVCEACHGVSLESNSTSENSLMLCAFLRGAVAFFGCTTASYAIRLPEGAEYIESGIDGLFNRLLFQLLRKGNTFGQALCESKRYQQLNNGFDEKNTYGLVLLGDPMLHFTKSEVKATPANTDAGQTGETPSSSTSTLGEAELKQHVRDTVISPLYPEMAGVEPHLEMQIRDESQLRALRRRRILVTEEELRDVPLQNHLTYQLHESPDQPFNKTIVVVTGEDGQLQFILESK